MKKQLFLNSCHQRGVNYTDVARTIGVSPSSVSAWNENTRLRGLTKAKLSKYFNVPLDYFDNEPEEEAPTGGRGIYMIPVFESVSAGFGAYADGAVKSTLPMFFDSEADSKEYMFIRVQGDSMTPLIDSGDMVLVRKTDEVDSGKVGVVLVDREEGYVKNVVYGSDWLELRSLNNKYQTLTFQGADLDRVCILGTVTQVIKNV